MTNFTNTNKTKGTSMNREQKASRTSTPNTGLAATLSNLFSGRGTRAPSSRLRTTLATLALALAAFAITAAPASAAVEMGTISNVSYASAHVTGKILSPDGGFGTSYTFESCTQECSEPTATWSPGPGGQAGTFEKDVEGNFANLKAATTYFVRLKSGAGSVSPAAPPYPSFTTLTADPTEVVQTDNASEVAYTTAKVTGKVNRPVKSNDLACHFQYITDEAFNNNPSGEEFNGAGVAPCEPGEGSVHAEGISEVEAHLANLDNNTAYHLRLAVSNAANADAKEAPSTFTTLTVDPPSVVLIQNASEVEYSQAQVKGIVERPATSPDPAFDVTCNFEYITDAQFKENEELLQPGFTGATPVTCEPEAHPAENPITATGQTPVKAILPGLSPSTTYHLRLSATNQGGSDAKAAPATFATAGPIPAPTIIATDDATDLAIHTATGTGEVRRPAGKDPALDLNCHFEYVTDQQFNENPPGEEFANAGRAECVENPITEATVGAEGKEKVSAQLGGLKAGTTFHLRLVAENVGVTVSKDAATTFTTLPANLPSVTIDPITEDAFTRVHISGTVGEGGICRLQISTDKENWSGPEFGESGCTQPKADFNGLQPATTYYLRITAGFRSAVDGFGGWAGAEAIGEVAYSPTLTLNTEPVAAPTVVFDPVTDITANGAHFSGSVDTNAPAGPLTANAKAAYKTEWHFECSPACPQQPGLSGTVTAEEGSVAISTDVKHLDANTPYQVKLIAKNVLESGEAEQTFPTPLVKPTVTALPGASDGEGGYVLAGIVNPNNSPVTSCKFKWGPNSASYAFEADCSPVTPINGAKPVTVEAHLTKLNPGSVYHFKLFATNGAGTEESNPDREFIPTLAEKGPACPNEQLRAENGSLGLPECRAYEMATYPNKEGTAAMFNDFNGGDALLYSSTAQNLANSGTGEELGRPGFYIATRSAAGWETIPDLNGPTGSLKSAPQFINQAVPALYSPDLLSSVWAVTYGGDKGVEEPRAVVARRAPDGTFTSAGRQGPLFGGVPNARAGRLKDAIVGSSDDLSHVVVMGAAEAVTYWGQGIYEFVGTGNDQPRRVDIANSGIPISTCVHNIGGSTVLSVSFNAISTDGSAVAFTVDGGCGGANPPANEVWARVGGTTSYDVSASLCTRTAPADPCNAPANATYQGAAKDGSRVYFTTKQQLVNGDTDQTNDLYACDIPPGTPTPSAEPANPCSALHEASAGSAGKANVQKVVSVSDDGSTAYFTARGVLAGNDDGLGEEALPGDENLYVWRTDAAHPDGQIGFVARLPEGNPGVAQTTPNGRYLVLQTAGQLLSTDTDEATDIYRYDAVNQELVRVSTAVSGAGGNGEFDATLSGAGGNIPGHNSHLSISDDGRLIVFKTTEALSPLDGNGEPDAYLWNDGHNLGSVAPLLPGNVVGSPSPGEARIDGSGQDIYVRTAARLNQTDVDFNSDIYDVRTDGGFPQRREGCVAEACQPSASAPPAPPAPDPRASDNPGAGNPTQPKTCPKGKVRKHGKCVKKSHGKHHKKKGKGQAKRASHNRGGSK